MNRPPSALPKPHWYRGFTLVEMLVVLLIMVVLFGIAIAIPLGEEREGQVRGAAEELAAVLRETRTRAMRENRTFAVAFNIENAPGSSGKILNNRSGGHWYRVLGPSDTLSNEYWLGGDGDSFFGKPPLFDYNTSALNGRACYETTGWPALRHYIQLVERSWIDEPHRLIKGKVRFLALTDQDNGDNDAPAQGGYYTATYPRPWFGWWDSTTKELHTWGGYDPNIKMVSQGCIDWWRSNHSRIVANGRAISHSGFFYEGFEGEITGCTNPADRQVVDDGDNDGNIASPNEIVNPTLWTVLKKGEPRPLINGNWVDFAIIFHPNGSVDTDWFRLREGYRQVYGYIHGPSYLDPYTVVFPTHDDKDLGLADMCGGFGGVPNYDDQHASYIGESHVQREATDFAHRSGYYWITLATDAKDDRSTFATAEEALHSLNPIYRVGVSPDGAVKVIRIHNTNYEKRFFDTTITGSDWQDKNKIWGKAGPTWYWGACTTPNYVNHELRNANGSPRGLPIFDVVLPEMLKDRKWWWEDPP